MPSGHSSSRVGAHRPRRRTWPAVAVLLLVLITAGVVVGVRTLDGVGRPTAASTSTGTPAAATSAVPTPVPSSGSPTPEPVESSGASSGSSAEPTGEVDRAAPVTVLNATGRAGLATGVATILRSAGWSVTGTGNYRRTAPPTTVYYPGSRLRDTARAISDDLPGTQRVVRSTQFGDAVVTVVIGSDYSG
jgi:hypothetical protein